MCVVTNLVVAMMIVSNIYKPVTGMKLENGMFTNVGTLYEKTTVTNYQYSTSLSVNSIEIDCRCDSHFTARPEDLFCCSVTGIFFDLGEKHPVCDKYKKEMREIR